MTVKNLKLQTNIINNNNLDRKVLFCLVSVFAVLVVSYVYFIGSIVFNILERKTVEADVRSLKSNVGQMELQYLSLNNSVDLAFAREKGYEEPKNLYFASRQSLVTIRN